MKTLMSGSAMENEPEENLADSFEHWPNEPATRNDLRILATLVDRRFAKIESRFNQIDVQLQAMRVAMQENLLNLKESFRMEMYKFAAAVIGTGIAIFSLAGFFSR
jgi:hypothetical protein